MASSKNTSEPDIREYARKQLKKKRDFAQSAAAYVIVNAGLVAIWFFWTRDEGFWPGWVILWWGVGLAFQYFDAYVRPFSRPITEADVDAEVERLTKPR